MEIVFIILSFICIALAGVAEAIMDKLQFHFDKSIFANFKNKQWWNPIDSWKNKWKNGDKEQGEKFWLSSTMLVFTTDAWHLFKLLRNVYIFLTILFISFVNKDKLILLIIVIALRIIFGLFFEITFKKYLNKK